MNKKLFDTGLSKMFGCKYPIVQGGLAYWSNADLAAAVSNAGGLGVITSYQFEGKEVLRAEIKRAKTLTDNPFGVNVNLFPAARQVNTDELVEVIIEEKVAFVETSGRSPEKFIGNFHQNNVKVIHKVPGLRYARHAEKIGVDAVTVAGFECGGHPGMEEVTTMVLVPATVEVVKIPVLAAGGISNGRGFLAALALGASGVVIGTRFLLTEECSLHPAVKKRLLETHENDTMIIDRSIRSGRRVLRNPAAERVLGMQQIDSKLEEQLAIMGGMSSKKYLDVGDLEHGVLSCGQSIGLAHDIPTVKDLIERMAGEASEIWERLNLSSDR